MTNWKREAEIAKAQVEALRQQLESKVVMQNKSKQYYDVSIDVTSIMSILAINAADAEQQVKAMHSSEVDNHIKRFGNIEISCCIEDHNE